MIPRTHKVESKFHSDLTGAKAKRRGEFKTFVFVFNDQRGGMPPKVSRVLAQAQIDHAPLTFEALGPKHLLADVLRLDRHEIEEVFGAPIQAEDVVYGVGLRT